VFADGGKLSLTAPVSSDDFGPGRGGVMGPDGLVWIPGRSIVTTGPQTGVSDLGDFMVSDVFDFFGWIGDCCFAGRIAVLRRKGRDNCHVLELNCQSCFLGVEN